MNLEIPNRKRPQHFPKSYSYYGAVFKPFFQPILKAIYQYLFLAFSLQLYIGKVWHINDSFLGKTARAKGFCKLYVCSSKKIFTHRKQSRFYKGSKNSFKRNFFVQSCYLTRIWSLSLFWISQKWSCFDINPIKKSFFKLYFLKFW